MTKNSRDEFLPKTKQIIGQRAGYICCVPTCRKLTIGPSDDRVGRITCVGVAAHITAAALGGPRYDVNISPEERASEHNGLWACQNHGKAIDDNASTYTKDELQRWKRQHEKWVFQRVAATSEKIESGLSNISVENIGIFREQASLEIGKNTVIISNNSGGKTTFCQAIAAFSGGENFENFQRRFDFGLGGVGLRAIEASTVANGGSRKIRLSQANEIGKKNSSSVKTLLYVEVEGGLKIDWPRRYFKVVVLDDSLWNRGGSLSIGGFFDYLANIFHIPKNNILSAMREELFVSTAFGYTFRRRGKKRVELKNPGESFFLEEEAIGPTALTFAFLDIILKMIAASQDDHPWILIVDTTFFQRLDQKHRAKLFTKLFDLREPELQVILCVSDEESLEFLKSIEPDRWLGASSAQNVAAHRFT